MIMGVCMYHNLMNNKKLRSDSFQLCYINKSLFAYMFSDNFLYKLNVLFHEAECRRQVLLPCSHVILEYIFLQTL